MDFEELTKQINELKAQGLKDEDILKIFFQTFVDGDVDAEDLSKMAGALGYKFSQEFENELKKEAEIQNQENGGEGEEEVGGEISQDEIEETKQLKDGESPEEFKEKIEDLNEDGDIDASEDADDEDEEENEDDEEEKDEDSEEDEENKAMKMFGLNK